MASYVAPGIKDKFETLSTDLKNLILKRNVELNNMQDLIRVLEQIVEEGEARVTTASPSLLCLSFLICKIQFLCP